MTLATRSTTAVAAPLLAAGVALGFAIRSPLLGWIGLVLTAYAVATPSRSRACHAALVVASSVIASLLRFGFVWRGLELFGAGPAAPWGALALSLSLGLFDRWPVALILLVAPGRHRALLARSVPLWLPPAWLVGELAMATFMNLELNGWLLTQARAAPMVHLVSWIGQGPTALLALALGALVGTSLAHRRGDVLALAAGVALASCAIPARVTDPRALYGVAALRLQRRTEQARDVRASLVVWPEAISRREVSLAEGPVDVRIAPPGVAPATHILGIVNRRAGRVQNSALAVTQDGRAFWHRAKTSLVALGEVTRAGLRIGSGPEMLPGEIEPVVSLGDRRVGVLICSEVFNRRMRERATPAGVDLVVVLAGDAITGDQASGRELMLNGAILAAAERHVAIARASMRGVAALIGPDGTVYARVEAGHLRAATMPAPGR